MTLSQFKREYQVEQLAFYPSKHSNRRVAGLPNEVLVITTEEFNPDEPGYVYGNPADEDGKSFILSNTAPKEAEFVL